MLFPAAGHNHVVLQSIPKSDIYPNGDMFIIARVSDALRNGQATDSNDVSLKRYATAPLCHKTAHISNHRRVSARHMW